MFVQIVLGYWLFKRGLNGPNWHLRPALTWLVWSWCWIRVTIKWPLKVIKEKQNNKTLFCIKGWGAKTKLCSTTCYHMTYLSYLSLMQVPPQLFDISNQSLEVKCKSKHCWFKRNWYRNETLSFSLEISGIISLYLELIPPTWRHLFPSETQEEEEKDNEKSFWEFCGFRVAVVHVRTYSAILTAADSCLQKKDEWEHPSFVLCL